MSLPRLKRVLLRASFVLGVSLLLLGSSAQVADAAWTLNSIGTFTGSNGSTPIGSVVIDASGNLWGTTSAGGAGSNGSIFEVVKGSNTVTTVASFSGANGANPNGGLFQDANGNFFGTTINGGTDNLGTVFEIVKGSNAITTIASFKSGGTNALNPSADVIVDSAGNIFGVTPSGGTNNTGAIFEIVHGTNTITTVASFGPSNGASPVGNLAFDPNGNIVGTTVYTGAAGSGFGTVFSYSPTTHAITTLGTFNGANGTNPYGGVVFDATGNLFGTTNSGTGTNKYGTIYEIAAGSNTITTLAAFGPTTGGINPRSGLVIDASGNLYGTATSGGTAGVGTIFELGRGQSTIQTLASFNTTNGSTPRSTLAFDSQGNLYGTASLGGSSNTGTAFMLAAPVPEPSAIALFAVGLVGGSMALVRGRRARKLAC